MEMKSNRLKAYELDLLAEHEKIENITSRIENQGDAMRYTGCRDDSLQFSSLRLNQIRRTNPSQEMI